MLILYATASLTLCLVNRLKRFGVGVGVLETDGAYVSLMESVLVFYSSVWEPDLRKKKRAEQDR